MTDLTVLKTELVNDPGGVGYATLIAAQNWRGLADAVNLVRPGTTVTETNVRPGRLRTQMVATEYFALTADQRELVRFYLSGDETIDVSPGTPIRAALSAAFPGGSSTRVNWASLLSRDGSRAEAVFGAGVTVRYEQCRDATRLP